MSRVDVGAVSVGLLIPLATFAPTMLGIVPGWLALVFIGIGVFLGGFLAARLRPQRSAPGVIHGTIVAVVLVLVVAVVAIAEGLAAGSAEITPPATTVMEHPVRLLLGIGSVLLLGGLGGRVGTHSNS